MKVFPSSELLFTAFVVPADKAQHPRLPHLSVSWYEDKPCVSRTREPRITELGYRAGMKPPNWRRKFPPEPLTPAEVISLLDLCDPTTKRGVRNRALLALLWRTGLRVSEALDLKPHHVDFDTKRVLVVCGKGSKTRTVAIDTGALVEVQCWLEVRAKLATSVDSPLFCTVNEPRQGNRLHSAYVRELCRGGRPCRLIGTAR